MCAPLYESKPSLQIWHTHREKKSYCQAFTIETFMAVHLHLIQCVQCAKGFFWIEKANVIIIITVHGKQAQ